ncbi:hypothetical protein WJR50_31165 [Catalinimonas sp. 4WD22]|uniref:hypothetical protein n=1 Tax=Catalinimonas locisalis TaxID=3133978 RepID=UPI003100C416
MKTYTCRYTWLSAYAPEPNQKHVLKGYVEGKGTSSYHHGPLLLTPKIMAHS